MSELLIPWIRFDIIHGDNIENLIDQKKFQNINTIVHLAAIFDRKYAIEHPQEILNVNVMGTLNVLEFSRLHDSKVIFASSSGVYGNSYSDPISEEYERKPLDIYGFSKRLAEDICGFYESTYGLKICILRFFDIYANDLKPNTLISDLVAQIFDSKVSTIKLLNNSSSLDYLHVDDVINSIIKCLERGILGIYNIGTGKAYKPAEIAEIFFNLTKTRKK